MRSSFQGRRSPGETEIRDVESACGRIADVRGEEIPEALSGLVRTLRRFPKLGRLKH